MPLEALPFTCQFIVATTGEINENARKMINKARNRGEQTNISYWDGSKLADDIRTHFLDEFIQYFGINEEYEEQFYYDEEYVVTENYIIDNYGTLVSKCMKIFSYQQLKIVKAIINYYLDLRSVGISIGDLLYELGTTEDDIREDLLNLQRLGCVDVDDDIIYLDGNANNLIELAENIIEEMVAADEYEGNEYSAKSLFYDLVE